PRMTRRPSRLPPRSTHHARSPPRTGLDPRVAPSMADPATRSVPASHGSRVDACRHPSPHLHLEVLRRPLEPGLGSVIGMHDRALGGLASPDRHLERVDDELSAEMIG